LVLIIVENRLGFFQLASLGSQWIHYSYASDIVQALGSPSMQVEFLPGLIFAQLFSLSPSAIEFFFFVIYHFACGVFTYFFLYRYFGLVLRGERLSVRAQMAISFLGSLLYMFFPYNVLGDNFPELFFVRSLIPLFFLLFMEFMESKRIVLFAISTVLLAYMTILDPRALIFVPVLAFFFLVLPKIVLIPRRLSKTLLLGCFLFCVVLGFMLTSYTITPRISTTQVPTFIAIPFVTDAFRYSFSDMINTFSGLSFEGTFQTVSSLPSGLAYYLPIVGLFTAIVAFSVFLSFRSMDRRLVVYASVPAVFAFAVLMFFVNLGGYPFFQDLLFSVPSAHLPSSLKTVALLFRTPRFVNMMLALFYSVFSCMAVIFFAKFLKAKGKVLTFFTQNGYQIITVHRKKLLSLVLVTLFLLSTVSGVVIFTSSGQIFGDLTGERANAYDEVNRIYGNTVGASILTVPYSSTLWNLRQAPVELSESVMRYIYAYTFDQSLPTSLLSRNQTDQMGDVLSMAGVKYIVVDEYNGKQERVFDVLNCSSSFVYASRIGQLHIFRVSDFDNIVLSDPILVNGGYETYFQTVDTLKSLVNCSSFSPIFMDSPTGWDLNNLPSFGTILSSPNKSMLDLMGSFMVNDENATVISLSQYTSHFNPANFWSPAFVSDTHHGVWTSYLGTLEDYDWDYSYNPGYGFVFTWGPDTLVADFSLSQTANYSVFIRSLHYPGDGRFSITVDSNQTQVNTGWNSTSAELVWNSLGDLTLTKGSHVLSISNEEGLNAINLIVIIPTERVTQLASVAEQFYGYAGDVKLLSPTVITNSSISKNETCSINVLQPGNYSALIRLTVQNPVDNTVKLVFNNQTYQTEVVSIDPYVVSAHLIMLPAGNQSVELRSSQHLSNVSAIVYGPDGSLADKMFSNYSDKSQIEAGNSTINKINLSYSEHSISFRANSSFMVVLPQLYTGTMAVSFDTQLNGIMYSTYPILNVFTGIWFKLPNETSPATFAATFYTDEGREFKASSSNFVPLVVSLIIIAIALDIVIMTTIKHNKNKQFESTCKN